MDIKEFVFRHMSEDQDPTEDLAPMVTSANSDKPIILKDDPEAIELCAQFLYQDIFLEGKTPDRGVMYPWAHFEALAKEFIEDIIPSDTFMHDALTFFNEIREGKR